MKINKLDIKNFKAIKHITFDKNKKVNLITGENGNGKSSILDAIRYILTDELDDKISSFVRWGTEKFEIICEFEHKGIEYTLEIEGSKGAKKRLAFNDEEYFNSEATSKLRDIIDFELTKYSAISEQGKTAQLLFQKKTERLNTLSRILKIDSINESSENVKEEVRKIRENVKVLETELNSLENAEFSLMDEITLPDIDEVKKEFEVIEKEKSDYDLKQKALDKEISEVKESISEIKLSFEKKKNESISNIKTEIINLENKIKEIKRKKNEFDSAVISGKTIKDEIKDLENSLNIKKKETKTVIEPSQSEEYLKQIYTKKIELEQNVKSIEKEIKSLKDRKCPYSFDCDKLEGVDVSKYEKDLELAQSEVTILEISYKKISDEIKIYKDTLSFNQKIEKEVSDIENKISLKKESIKKYQEVIDNYTEEDSINTESVLKLKKEEIESIEHLLSIERDKQIEVLQERINNLSEREGFLKEKEYSELKNKILLYDNQVKELERIKLFNEEVLKKKSKNERLVSVKKRELESKRKEINLMEEVRDAYKDFSAYRINKGAEHIKNRMNSIFQKGYGKYEITFEQDKSGIDFFYKEVGSDILNNVVMASGQEKAVLAVANRLALCSLQNLGILVLDEVDNNASDENSVKLFQTILNEKGFNQIWIISHCNATKEYLNNLVETSNYNILDGQVEN